MPVETVQGISNAEFFLRYAKPGMLGLLAAADRLMPDIIRRVTGLEEAGGSGRPSLTASLWSHSFVILDRVEQGGDTKITLVESTRIPRAHRSEAGRDAPGDPDWDGPQRSLLVCRTPQGVTFGQPRRKALRQYVSDVYTPNVALVDLRLSPAQVQQLQHDAVASLRPDRRYPVWELVGVLVQALRKDLAHASFLDSDDMFCSAYVRSLLGPLVPEIRALPVAEANTTCQHLYQALHGPYHVRQMIRSPSPGVVAASDAWCEDVVRRGLLGRHR